MVSGGKERSGTVSQTDALWPSTGERFRAVVSQVAVAGDRWWDADQAFLRRGQNRVRVRVGSIAQNRTIDTK